MKAPRRGRSLDVPVHVLTFSAVVIVDCPKGQEMFVVVGCFNEHAQKVLDVHLATGFHKYFMWCKGKLHGNHHSLIQESKDIVAYVVIDAIAMHKILKKYDKIHDSKQGQAFRSQVQSMYMELLQSPWICELISFHINLRESKKAITKGSEILEGCSLIFNDENHQFRVSYLMM
ncbi:unnamed protein product [Lactuca saligna]|uniref:RING-type E3 ubiquitin transferase n=1 Tax=Lactuca saligna TaxID=75948 RepID=A0AA35ZIT2_LACSI|nr:unnamed protein product [Lactuca saligna]